jgi:hypothetical protein
MGLFRIADLHVVMAHALTLAEGRNLDVFARAERVLGQHLFIFGLLESVPYWRESAARGHRQKRQTKQKNPRLRLLSLLDLIAVNQV